MLSSKAWGAASVPCRLFHSFVVMNTSSRFRPEEAKARPTPSSFW